MKKILLSLFVAIGLCSCATAQDTSKMVLKLTDQQMKAVQALLTPQQAKVLDQLNNLGGVTAKADTASQITNGSKYAGVGKEIGVAVNESLGAINKQAAAFAETKVGKLTMLIVAWKVLGEDVVGFTKAVFGVAIGVPILIAFNWFLIWFWKRTTSKTRLVTSEEGKKKVYQYEDTWYTKIASKDEDWDNPSRAQVFLLLWWIVFAIGNLIITVGAIF